MLTHEPIKKPKPLKSGDTIAVAATASSFDREAFLKGVQKIESWGFKVRYREDIFSKQRYLAGSDERRWEELKGYLLDPTVKAIFFARGGYGSMRILPCLSELPSDLPAKILMGYSDITSILTYFSQQHHWVTFHGPVVAKDIGDRMETAGESSLLRVLTDPAPLGKIHPPSGSAIFPGQAEGRLVGGCLSLIISSLGTPYQLKTNDAILFLEDVGEKLYSLDRMLTQLKYAGTFKGVRGIVFGPLKDTHDEPEVIKGLLKELLTDLEIPILFGYPSGHIEDSWTIPFGLPVKLDADQGVIMFEESALHAN